MSAFFSDYNRPNWPRRLLDQNFGLTLTPEDLLAAPTSPLISRFKPWWPTESNTVKVEKDKWQINVDVQHFTPEEITVKTVDGFILVEATHEEKEDEHGFISRQFSRKFKLPEGTNPDTVQSRLSSDGVLTVSASSGERAVHISQTGPIRKEVPDTKDESGQKEEKKE